MKPEPTKSLRILDSSKRVLFEALVAISVYDQKFGIFDLMKKTHEWDQCINYAGETEMNVMLVRFAPVHFSILNQALSVMNVLKTDPEIKLELDKYLEQLQEDLKEKQEGGGDTDPKSFDRFFNNTN